MLVICLQCKPWTSAWHAANASSYTYHTSPTFDLCSFKQSQTPIVGMNVYIYVVYVMCTGCCCCVFLFLLLTILFGWVGLSSSLSPFGNAVCMFFFFFYLFSSIQYIRPFELCCVYATNTLPLKRSGLPTNARTHTNSSSYIYNKIHSIRISRDNRILCERHPIQLVLPCSGWHIQYTQAVATTVASYWIMRRIIQLYVTYLMRA